jgi:hypothetical protein
LQEALQNRKIGEKESYETVIWDLIEDTKELSEETKRDIAEARADFADARPSKPIGIRCSVSGNIRSVY